MVLGESKKAFFEVVGRGRVIPAGFGVAPQNPEDPEEVLYSLRLWRGELRGSKICAGGFSVDVGELSFIFSGLVVGSDVFPIVYVSPFGIAVLYSLDTIVIIPRLKVGRKCRGDVERGVKANRLFAEVFRTTLLSLREGYRYSFLVTVVLSVAGGKITFYLPTANYVLSVLSWDLEDSAPNLLSEARLRGITSKPENTLGGLGVFPPNSLSDFSIDVLFSARRGVMIPNKLEGSFSVVYPVSLLAPKLLFRAKINCGKIIEASTKKTLFWLDKGFITRVIEALKKTSNIHPFPFVFLLLKHLSDAYALLNIEDEVEWGKKEFLKLKRERKVEWSLLGTVVAKG